MTKINYLAILALTPGWAMACDTGAPLGWPVDQAQIREVHACKSRTDPKLAEKCHAGIEFSSVPAVPVRAVCSGQMTISDITACDVNPAGRKKLQAINGVAPSCSVKITCNSGSVAKLSGLSFLQAKSGPVKRGQAIGQVGGETPGNLLLNVCKTPDCGKDSQINPLPLLDACNAPLRNSAMTLADAVEQHNMCGSSKTCYAYNKIYTVPDAPPVKQRSCDKDMASCVGDWLFEKVEFLSASERRELAKQLPIQTGATGLVDTTCQRESYLRLEVTDFNSDGQKEIIVTEGNACIYGDSGGRTHFFSKIEGKWAEILTGQGDPFMPKQYVLMPDKIKNWPNIVPAKPGLCQEEYAWSEKTAKYEFLRDAPDPSAPGGCVMKGVKK